MAGDIKEWSVKGSDQIFWGQGQSGLTCDLVKTCQDLCKGIPANILLGLADQVILDKQV